MRKLPPLRALQVFEAAARQSHFSRAAEELCITQSAVSHQVRLLEEHFGESLFQRQGRSLKLSPKGEILYGELERIFNELADLGRLFGEPNRELKLAVYSSFAVKWLIPRLSDFRRRHPEVQIRLEMVTQDPELSDSVADLFISGGLKRRGYWQTVLHKERLIPVCSPQLPPRAGQITIQSLQQYPLLTVDEGPLGLDWNRWAEANGVTLTANHRQHIFSHVLMAIEAAIAGQGIALASDFMVEDDIASGRLIEAELPDVHTGFEFTFCCKERRLKEQAIAAFADWLMLMASQPQPQ